MTFAFSTNNTPLSHGHAFYLIKEFFKNHGWTIASSGDGTSAYSAGGDCLTGYGSGVNGTANYRAWFRVQMPTANGVVREWTWQHDNGGSYRVKHVYSAGFTAGSPSKDTTPSDPTEFTLWGSGSDAGPGFAQWGPASVTMRLHMCLQTTAPYGGYILMPVAGSFSGTNFGVWMHDPLASNSVDPSDTDPYVHTMNNSGSRYAAGMSDDSGGSGGNNLSYFAKGTGSEGLVNVAALTWALWEGLWHPVAPGGGVMFQKTIRVPKLPVFWGRRTNQSSPNGPRGRSTLLHSNAAVPGPGFTTFTDVTSNDLAMLGDFLYPWDGSRVLL